MRPCALWVVCLVVLATPILGARLAPSDGPIVLEAGTLAGGNPSPPAWAEAYSVEFVVSMPYLYLTQPQGLSIPVKAWYDHGNKRSRIENFGGMDTVMFLKGKQQRHTYEVHPRVDHLQCWVDYQEVAPVVEEEEEGGSGALQGLLGGVVPILPDLSDWLYAGKLDFDGTDAYVWQLQYREGEAVDTYNFYTSVAGAPLKLHMFGYNTIAYGHYDEYIYDFKSYTPGQDNAAFEVPELCKEGSPQRHVRQPGQTGWLARQASMLMPASRVGGTTAAKPIAPLSSGLDAAHALWALATGRAPARDEGERLARAARFRSAAERVAAHNAQPDKTYTMQLGRFADWSEEEYYGTLMPDAWRRKQGLPSAREARKQEALKTQPHAFDPIGKFKRRMKRNELPREVDWRGTGADPGVKDQGMCGSCWSFGATAAMEGAWYVHVGEKRSFSEQQLIDCSYDWTNVGCDGGDSKPAINYVASAGGIAIEQDYYYHSTGDFCRTSNFTLVGRFDGFLQVEPRDELAMMEAVYTMGPLSVALDPSPDAFAYYKEGVFSDKSCSTADLDHQVILFGYGTTDDGVDYWLVKNMWSKFWGADGYIKIARGPHDCGVASDGVVAVVSNGAMRAGARSRSLEAVRRW